MAINEKKQTLYAFFLNWVSKFVTYILLVVFANLYIKDSYGEATFIMAIFNICLLLITVGLPFLFVPWTIRKKDIHSVFYFLFISTIILVLVSSPLLIIKPWVYPLMIALPFVLLYNFGLSFLRVDHKYGLIQIFGISTVVITLIVAILFKNLDKFAVVLAYALGYIISTIPLLYLERKYFLDLLSHFVIKLSVIKEYLVKGFMSSLILLSFYFLGWIDSTILGLMSTYENVANYNIASPISNLISIIPIAISTFLLTKVSELKQEDMQKNILKRAIRISYFGSLMLSILIISLLPFLIKIFFKNYIGIEPYVLILIMGILFYSVYLLIYTHMTGKLEPEKAFLPMLFAALLNIILDILFIPRFGLYGICIATFLAHALAFTLLAIKLKLLKEFWYIYILPFVLVLCYLIGYYGLFLIIILIPLSFLLKLITIDDINVVKDTIFSMIKFK